MKKKFLAMLLAMVIAVSLIPMAAMATCNNCATAPYVPGDIFMTHYQRCECGNEFNSGTCVANEEGICGVCKRPIKHDCDTNAYVDKIGYHLEGACSICGEGGSKKGHSHGKISSVSDTEHAKVCACGNMKSRANHKDENGDEQCDTCGYKHECDYVAEYVADHKHKLVCSCGKVVEDVKCMDPDGDKFCDSCKERLYEDIVTPPHEHNFVVHSNDNGTHHTSCTCGEYVDVKCQDSDGDRFCDSCEYEMYRLIVTPHEHNYVSHPNNDGTHNLSCTCGGAYEDVTCIDADGDRFCDSCEYEMYREITTPHEHNYVSHSNNNGTHNMSCTCGGFVENVTCLDVDGDNFCDSCGYQKYNHKCVGGAWTSNNDGTHSSKCSCGSVMDGPNECQTIDGMTCYMCKYNMHDHDYDAGVTSNEDGTHNINCACGEFVVFTCLDNDGDGKCDSCGYQKYTAPEETGCTHPQHDLMIGLGCPCPKCKECGHTWVNGVCKWCQAEENEDSDDDYIDPKDCDHVRNQYRSLNNGMHNEWCACGRNIVLQKACEDAGEGKCVCGYEIPADEETAPGCTFGQHDQMIELGNICPICHQCGHTFIEGTCKWCFKEEPKDDNDEDTVHKCFAEIKAEDNNDGKTHKILCAECNAFWKDEAHAWDNGVCSACNAKIPFQTTPDPKHEGCLKPETCTGKVLMTTVKKEATCTEAGQKELVWECGKFTVESIPANGEHDWDNGVCSACGEKSPYQATPVPKHEGCFKPEECNGKPLMTTAKKAPTCTEAGLNEVVWPCGKLTTESVPATGHHYTSEVAGKDPTCTEPGYTAYELCSCGAKSIHSQIPATGHTYINGECACGQVDPSFEEEVIPPVEEEKPNAPMWTWDWLNVTLVGNSGT